MYQCFGSGHPGSWIKIFPIPDPRSQIHIKEFKYFNQKNCFWALGIMIRVVHPGSESRIWILIFYTSRIQGSKRQRIPDPEHWNVQGNWEWPLRAPKRGACTWCRIRRWGTASPAPPAPGSPGWTPPGHPPPQLGTGVDRSYIIPIWCQFCVIKPTVLEQVVSSVVGEEDETPYKRFHEYCKQ